MSTDHDKNFATARAQLALRGFTLHRTDPRDGPVWLVVEHRGRVWPLRSVEHLESLLIGGQMGGAPA